jgi:hypothetical protein
MRDNEKCNVFVLACRLQEINHLLLMSRIDTCSWFIGKKDTWTIRKCSSDCNPLLLANTQGSRFMVKTVSESD